MSLVVEVETEAHDLSIASTSLVLELADPTSVLPAPTYDIEVDLVTDLEIYKGEAQPGADPAAAVWRIRRHVVSDDLEQDVSTTWAGGTDEFDKVWNDHLTYIYS